LAITFDTTVSGESSTSYVEVTYFVSFLEKLINTDDTPKGSQTTLIKKLLNIATEVVDSLSFGGSETVLTQSLQFPRQGLYDRRGYSIDEDTIPNELKDAVCEQALWIYQNELNHAQHDDWDDEVQSASIGGSLTFGYNSGKKPSTMIPKRVKFMLKRIGSAYIPHGNRVRRS